MKHRDVPNSTSLSDNHFENLFNVYDDDGVYYYNLMKTVNIPESLDPGSYFLLTVDNPMSLTTLSFRVYGSINLWWLICIANNINDTVKPITPGRTLRIIHPSYIPKIKSALESSL